MVSENGKATAAHRTEALDRVTSRAVGMVDDLNARVGSLRFFVGLAIETDDAAPMIGDALSLALRGIEAELDDLAVVVTMRDHAADLVNRNPDDTPPTDDDESASPVAHEENAIATGELTAEQDRPDPERKTDPPYNDILGKAVQNLGHRSVLVACDQLQSFRVSTQKTDAAAVREYAELILAKKRPADEPLITDLVFTVYRRKVCVGRYRVRMLDQPCALSSLPVAFPEDDSTSYSQQKAQAIADLRDCTIGRLVVFCDALEGIWGMPTPGDLGFELRELCKFNPQLENQIVEVHGAPIGKYQPVNPSPSHFRIFTESIEYLTPDEVEALR